MAQTKPTLMPSAGEHSQGGIVARCASKMAAVACAVAPFHPFLAKDLAEILGRVEPKGRGPCGVSDTVDPAGVVLVLHVFRAFIDRLHHAKDDLPDDLWTEVTALVDADAFSDDVEELRDKVIAADYGTTVAGAVKRARTAASASILASHLTRDCPWTGAAEEAAA